MLVLVLLMNVVVEGVVGVEFEVGVGIIVCLIVEILRAVHGIVVVVVVKGCYIVMIVVVVIDTVVGMIA